MLCEHLRVWCRLVESIITYVAVPGRNQTLFCCVFRLHYHIQSAVAQLRVGLIHAAKMHEYLISLCNGYEPRP